jgi:hemolysin-activating ACP:hemolysin acyltransferase
MTTTSNGTSGGNAGPSAQATPKLSSEDAARVNEMAKLMATALGEIVTVLMRAPEFRHVFLSELEWRVMPAIASRQFALGHVRHNESGLQAPIAVVLWANVSAEVDSRLTANVGQPIRLQPSEWTGGPHAWMVEAVGDLRAIRTLIQQTLAGPLKGRTLKLAIRDDKGQSAVQTVQAAGAAPRDPAPNPA